MELEKVRELVDMMKANDLSELEIVDGQMRIMLKRGSQAAVAPAVVAVPQMMAAESAVPLGGQAGAAQQQAQPDQDEKLVEIVAPMVGTLFVAASPSAEPFLEIGSKVDQDTVVCIIEAMKVMNEIKSEVKGTIRKILVENGSAVEYGQALYLVEPD